ncbi:MAG: hypothetical protein GX444_15170 [Myxococcales bacterium]|nr:hypothetical protein [Myxococcales bacterium]
MVEKAKKMIPDFIKDGLNSVAEPLGKAEKAIEAARDRLVENAGKLDSGEIKKVFDDLLKKVQKARGEVEGYLTSGMNKTWQALNLPTRDELEVVKADVARLSKDLKALNKPIKAAAKKAPAKKAAVKKGKKKGK